MMVKNPFKYGEPVTGEDFTDRENECKEIAHDLYSGQNIILYSPRRLGKTSLIIEIEKRLKRTPDVCTCYIDLFGILSQEELAERIVNGIMLSTYPIRTALEKAVNVLLKLVPVKVAVMRGETRLELIFGRKASQPQLEETFNLPEKAALNKKKHLIVFFDEFQEINSLNGVKLEKLMRSKFQHHKNVSYLFAGSKVSILREMFEDGRRAFYKFGKIATIKNIPKNDFFKFIKTKFSHTEKKINDECCESILEFTRCHPYATQQLCHELWYITEKNVEKELVIKAINNIITKQKDTFERLWDSMRSKSQKTLLTGLAEEPDANIYSKEFIEKYNLVSSAHVQKAIKQLRKKRIIENGKIADIFFTEWLKKREGGGKF